MADFQTRFKLFPYRYTYTDPGLPETDLKTVYRETNRTVLSAAAGVDVRLHDCQEAFVQDIRDKRQWDCFILAHSLQATAESVETMHERHTKSLSNWQLRLLFNIGNEQTNSGSGKAQFLFPRAVTTRSNAEVLIADTSNHRIQVLNQFGVYITSFGQFGSRDGQFHEPTGISAMRNDEIAVADSGNLRVQVFDRANCFKYSIAVAARPYTVTTDSFDNIIVGTTDRQIKVYRKSGKQVSSFQAWSTMKGHGTIHVCALASTNSIAVSDPLEKTIKTFSYAGQLMSTFSPRSPLEGIAVVPGGLFVESTGDIVVCDILNHTVNLYQEDGTFVAQLLGPQEGLGAVQTCTVGPEGHLIVTEYATNGRHCCKIYRYHGCACHQFRPGSSKRPASKPA